MRRRKIGKLVLWCIAISICLWKILIALQYATDDVDKPVKNNFKQKFPSSAHARSHPKKVLLFTYSRGGSSFLGELINRNRQGFYVFEPLLGMYSALYGIGFGTTVPEAVFQYKNGTDRWPTEFEAHFIAQQLGNILSCQLDKLEVEILQDKLALFYKKNYQFSGYKSCLLENPHILNKSKMMKGHDGQISEVTPNLIQTKINTERHFPFTIAFDCLIHARNYCGFFFDNQREHECFHNIIHNQKIPYTIAYKPLTKSKLGQMSAFKRLNQCLRDAAAMSAICLHELITPCMASDIRAVKVIRMRMENVGLILKRDPTIKIVHYFRDPRGVEMSRSRSMLGNRQKQMIKDANVTCRKMHQDIVARKLLEKQYPGSFLVLKYEDLAMEPMKTAEKLYGFLGNDLPIEVRDWLKQSTRHNNSMEDRVRLSTLRYNSSATAHKWKIQLPRSTAVQIGEICSDILKEFSFEL